MLDLQGITKRFGDVTAVNDVSFTVPAGQLVGFVGGNGAGKTTTMRIVMGVLHADAGEVRWGGEPITAGLRRQIGYMPEERGLYPKQPIVDQLVYIGQLHGMSGGAAREFALAGLETFGLGGRSKDRLEKLSLGNQQRVQIIAALLGEPVALILDEPFSGLDPDAVDAMVQLLRERTAVGVPVLFSSHQLDLVERLCDRLVVLSRSRLVAEGTVDELRHTGVVRHRLVLDGPADWVRGIGGVEVASVDGNVAVLEPLAAGAERELLTEALRRGSVREFARVVPTLAEIYREVSA